MKNLLFILFVFVSLGLQAQVECNKTLYDKYMRQGADFVAKEKYMDAVTEYIAALTICPQEAQKIQVELTKVFTKVNQLKDNALKAQKEALAQKNEAEKQKQLALQEQEKTKLALAESEKQKAKNQKLVDAFYFYKDRFALAFKGGQFYFIDKNGDPVKKLGYWHKAEQFEYSGFAKVIQKQGEKILIEILLDTLGNIYQVAYKIDDLNAEIKALDLTGTKLEAFPMEVLAHSQLEVLILNDTQLSSLPSQIGELKNLKEIKLADNPLVSLPKSLESFLKGKTDLSEEELDLLFNPEKRTELDLSNENLTSIPSQVWELKNLTKLNLSRNQISSLPSQIGELKNLTELNLESNELTELPIQIGELENLTTLDLKANALQTLPIQIGKLQNLQAIKLLYNPLIYLPKSLANFLKDRANFEPLGHTYYDAELSSEAIEEKLNLLYNQEGVTFFTYRINANQAVNQAYYRKNAQLSAFLDDVLNIKPLSETNRVYYTEEWFTNRENIAHDYQNFYFEIDEAVLYNGNTQNILPYCGFLRLYYRISDTESRFICSFDKRELAEKVLQGSWAIWINPFDCTDQRYYHHALYNGLFAGDLVYVKDMATGIAKKIRYQADIDSLSKVLKKDFNRLKTHTFSLAQSQKNAWDTLALGTKTYHTVFPDSIYLTDIWYEFLPQKNNDLMGSATIGAVNSGIMRSFENDSLKERKSYESFVRSIDQFFLNKQRPINDSSSSDWGDSYEPYGIAVIEKEHGKKIGEMLSLELKFPLLFSKKSKKMLKPQFFIEREYGWWQASLNLYVDTSGVGKQKDFLCSFAMKEVIDNVLKGNSDLKDLYKQWAEQKIKVRAIAYTDPVTGNKIPIKNQKDFELLRSRLGNRGNAVEQLVYEGYLSDFKE